MKFLDCLPFYKPHYYTMCEHPYFYPSCANHDFYAIKVLSKQNLTENAKTYCWKVIFHLCILYPYLLSILDKYVLNMFNIPENDVEQFVNCLYQEDFNKENYEECDYAIYYALKYDINITNIDVSNVIETNDCVFMLISYLYFKAKNKKTSIETLYKHALYLWDNDMDRNWLFVYEVLEMTDLKDEWKD